jgi:hypothetical protein
MYQWQLIPMEISYWLAIVIREHFSLQLHLGLLDSQSFNTLIYQLVLLHRQSTWILIWIAVKFKLLIEQTMHLLRSV